LKNKIFREIIEIIPEITSQGDSIPKALSPLSLVPTCDEFRDIQAKLTQPEMKEHIEIVQLTAREAAILLQAYEMANQEIISLNHNLKITEDYGNARDVIIKE